MVFPTTRPTLTTSGNKHSEPRISGQDFRRDEHVLGSVGLVTLSLGAIGIVNIMLVAVADRTREIGLRKALGATNHSIMFQFFTEGAFLTVLSGGFGIGGLRPSWRR